MSFLPQNGREWGIAGGSGIIGGVLTVLGRWGWKKIAAPKPVPAPVVEAPKTGKAG